MKFKIFVGLMLVIIALLVAALDVGLYYAGKKVESKSNVVSQKVNKLNQNLENIQQQLKSNQQSLQSQTPQVPPGLTNP